MRISIIPEIKRLINKQSGFKLTDEDREIASRFDVCKEIEKAELIRNEKMTEQQLQAEFEAKMKALGYSESTLRKMVNGEYYFAGIQVDYQRFKDGVEVEDQKLDPVVEANRALLHDRSQLGIKKYGVTLGEANLSQISALTNALEEALDLANYLQAEIMRLKNNTAKNN